MKNFRIFISLLLVAASVFMGVAFFPTHTRALGTITISSAKVVSNKTVLVTFNNPGTNLVSVTASKWHIDENDGGVSPLTATAAVITSAGSPWTVTLTFDPHPAWPTDQSYKDYAGLYVDAGGVSNVLGDTNVVVANSDSIVIADGQRPTVSTATITGANAAIITYSEQVSTVAGDYTNLVVGGISRSVTSINTDANPDVVLNFNGAAAAADATGSVKIDNVVDNAEVPNTITGISSQTISDGQAPSLTSVNEFDVNHDGAIDEFLLGFDEAIADSSVVPSYFVINSSVPANTKMAANSTNGLDTNTANDSQITVRVDAGVSGTEAKDVVHLINSVTDAAGNSIANGTFFAASATDRAAPVVMSKSPASGATDVAQSSDVVVTFSEPMNTASPAFSFTFSPAPSYTSSWSNSNKTLTLGSMALSTVAGYSYTVNMTAASAAAGTVTALYGLPYSWSFTVEANHVPASGGGSGGSSYMPSFASLPVVVATPTPPPATASSSPNQAAPEPPPAVGPAAPGVPASPATVTPVAPSVAIPAEVFRAFKRYLFYGTRGTEVSLLQALLKQLGFFHFPRVTGYFGPYTRAAVRRFQAAHNIEQVGTVGPKTRAALNALP